MAQIRIPVNRKTQPPWGEHREHPELQENIPGCPFVVGKEVPVPLHTSKALPGKLRVDVAQLRKEAAESGGAGVGAMGKAGSLKEIRTVTSGSWEVMKGHTVPLGIVGKELRR